MCKNYLKKFKRAEKIIRSVEEEKLFSNDPKYN